MKRKHRKRILAIIFVISILAGNIFPANTLVQAEEDSGRIFYGVEQSDDKLLLRLYGTKLNRISSFTHSLSYDKELLKLSGYEPDGTLRGALVSVNDLGGEVRTAIVSQNGFSTDWNSFITLEFEMLFTGGKDLTFESTVIECTDNLLRPVKLSCDSPVSTYVENSKRTYYTFFIESRYNVEINKETSVIIGTDRNAGLYSGSFILEYNKDNLDFKSIEANDHIKKQMAISYNEIADGKVQVAFACEDVYSGFGALFDVVFVPVKPNQECYVHMSDLEITTLELEEIEYPDSHWYGYIYTSSERGNNYFKIDAPKYLEAFETVDVDVELVNNSGFSAATMELLYDSEVFTFEECTFENGIFENTLASASGEKQGAVKIAAVSAKNITESGKIATIRFKSIENINKTADFEIRMIELVDSSAKEVEHTLGMHQMRINSICEHEYGEPVFQWNDNYSQCTAVFTCKKDAEHIREEVCSVSKVVTDAECETDGSIVYIATVMDGMVEYSDQWGYAIAAPGHSYDVEGICSNCGERNPNFTPVETPSAELKISGASLTLQDNLTINYMVKSALFKETGYEEPYMTFVLNGKETVVSDYVDAGENYIFAFRNIAPNQMNDMINATLHAKYKGVHYQSASRDYGVITYCSNMLGKSTSDQGELRTLLVDLLNYGAESQLYTGYRIDSLVNASLTETHKSWGTQTDRTWTTVQDISYKIINNPSVTWKGAGLLLTDRVQIRLSIAADDITNLKVKAELEDGTHWFIPSTQFRPDETREGRYDVDFTGLNSGQMSEPVYFTVYEGDTVVSNTVRYSIESYAYAQANKATTDEALLALLKVMMKYGDSAYEFAH